MLEICMLIDVYNFEFSPRVTLKKGISINIHKISNIQGFKIKYRDFTLAGFLQLHLQRFDIDRVLHSQLVCLTLT